MKLGRLNHIGVATPSLEASLAYYRDVMGATLAHDPFVDTPGENGTAGTQIELIEPLGEASPIHGFLAKNPAGGQHHMCYEVPDIMEAKAWFERLGKKILGEPRIGAHGTPIFFVHPKDMNGVLTEIMETPKEAH